MNNNDFNNLPLKDIETGIKLLHTNAKIHYVKIPDKVYNDSGVKCTIKKGINL